jgi:hypothetical protein
MHCSGSRQGFIGQNSFIPFVFRRERMATPKLKLPAQSRRKTKHGAQQLYNLCNCVIISYLMIRRASMQQYPYQLKLRKPLRKLKGRMNGAFFS